MSGSRRRCYEAEALEEQGDRDESLELWAAAAAVFRNSGLFEEEFAVRRKMLQQAALEDLPDADHYGEQCLAAAPASTPADELAWCHHYLAVAYESSERYADAIESYRHTIEQTSRHEPGRNAVAPLLLEVGLLEAALGRADQARRDLEACAASGLPHLVWIALTTLAEMHRREGELGAAARRSEEALDVSISMTESLVCRAHSLHFTGVMLALAGDHEAAYERFRQLLAVHQPGRRMIILPITKLSDYPVAPPLWHQCLWWAHLAAERTGRPAEAHALLERFAQAIRQDEAYLPEGFSAPAGALALQYAVKLVRVDPAAALEQFAKVTGEPSVMTHVDVISGVCLLSLGHAGPAEVRFRRALPALDHAPDADLELVCRRGLVRIMLARGQHEEAEVELGRCVALLDRRRVSLPRTDERMSYLATQIELYDLLVTVRVRLGRPAAAWEAVQAVRSRTLTDLLAQPDRRPIDHDVETRADGIEADRRRWIADHAEETHLDGTLNDRLLDMLRADIDRRAGRTALEQERRSRGLFDALTRQDDRPPTFAEVKILLGHSPG